VSQRPLVLVVEDDESIRQFLELALRDEGYEVVSAADGAQALATLNDLTPAVILLDVRMPVMDGVAFVRAYRERPAPHAPVVLVTAARDAEVVPVESLVDAVLQKPFNIEDLLRVIGELLPRPTAPRPPEPQ
jgi:CheY-like chemotaxis protein